MNCKHAERKNSKINEINKMVSNDKTMSSFKMQNLQSESELERIIMETKDSNIKSKLDVNKI